MCHDIMGETHMLLEQVDYAIGKEIEVDRSYTLSYYWVGANHSPQRSLNQ